MSAISSLSPAANVYENADRKSLAHLPEVIDGTQQSLADDDKESADEGTDNDHDSGATLLMVETNDTTTSSTVADDGHVLNVTA